MTNYHKLNRLTHTGTPMVVDVRSLKWLSLGENQGVEMGAFLLQTLEENLFPLLFPVA